MKAKYDESENLSNEEMLEGLVEYDPEFVDEKKEELSDIVEGREDEKEIGSPNKEAFDKDEYRLGREISEKYLERNIDLLRENDERLADELQARYEKIDADSKREWRERKEAKEKGEMYIGPDKSAGQRERELERTVVDALYGLTPDAKSEILEDYDEIIEHHEGKDYLDKRRNEILSEHSHEENEERIDESDMTPEEKASWKMRSRTKYGK